MKKPFGIVSGEGLGLANTTYRILGDSPIEMTTAGQAPVKSYANVANGNLVVQTPPISMDELGGRLNFFWTYNSQAPVGQNWRHSWQKQLINPNPNSNVLQLMDADGHLTTFTKDPNRGNQYFSNQVGEGTPFIRFDDNSNCWRWYDPKTHLIHYYDKNTGRLVQQETLEGNITNFQYDYQGNLNQIIGASGEAYIVDWGNNTVVFSVMQNNQKLALRIYNFDVNKNLLNEMYAKSLYTVNYNYNNGLNILNSVTQTDQTNLTFGYDSANVDSRQVSSIQYGGNVTRIDYSQSPLIVMRDAAQSRLEIGLDNQQLIAQVKTQTGYSMDSINAFDVTNFQNTNGVLTQTTLPDGSIIQATYDPVYHLKQTQTGPDNQKRAWYYQPGGDKPLLISRADFINPNNPQTAAVTRFVYDPNFDGQQHTFLRFQISPEGSVTEFRPFNRNNENFIETSSRANEKIVPRATSVIGEIASKRHYFGQAFDLSGYPNPQDVPAYGSMQQWVTSTPTNASQVRLTDYARNNCGQAIFEKNYTAVDANGQGIQTNTMGLMQRGWSVYGDCVLEVETQDATTQAVHTYSFDDLRRNTLHVDPLKRQWQWQFQDAQQQVVQTQPNGRQDTLPWDAQGANPSHLATVMNGTQTEARLTQFRRDNNALPLITFPPTLETQEANLPREHQFFDRQYRLGFKVSRSGQVIETRYDAAHRLTLEIKYNSPVDITKLYMHWPPQPYEFPYLQLLKQQLPSQPGDQDQVTLKCHTASGKLRYHVDGERYLIETIYDNLDRAIATVHYAAPLTDAEWQALNNGQLLNRVPDSAQDAINRNFYNKDNKIIATQDADGYVIEHVYDADKREIETIVYANPVPVDLAMSDFNQVRPQPNKKDGHTFIWYNNRHQEIARVDAENYLTVTAYFANDQTRQTTRFANAVTLHDRAIPIAVPSTEDQTTVYTYDLAKRKIQVDKPFGATDKIQYDVSDNITLAQTFDRQNPTLVDPNHQRNTRTIFDGWNQPLQQANVFVGQQLVEIETNPNLNEQQKAAQKQMIWQQNATRNHYDETGLQCWSRNSLGGMSYIYYDVQLRPVFKINPTGSIEQTVYNAFNKPVATYLFANQISPDKFKTLTGGMITDDFKTYLDSLRDKTKDRITINSYDRRNLKTETVDPEGYIATFKYNALRRCVLEQLALNDVAPSFSMSHQYNGRGLETLTTKTDGKTNSSVGHEYNNPLGKETAVINELGGRTEKGWDKLGRQTHQMNPLTIRDFKRQHDAFDRIKTEENAEGNITQHQYNQVAHSHTAVYPVSGYTQTEIQDFDHKTVQVIDAQKNADTVTHAPHGKVHTQMDALNNTTTTDYNLLGASTAITHPTKSIDTKNYNVANQLTQDCVDANHLALTTNYQLNAAGECEKIIDPRLVITENTINRNGLTVATLIDPSVNGQQGLNMLTTREFNGQKTQIAESHGDINNPNLYQETYQTDGIGRNIGKTIAPATLHLETEKLLNAAGQVVAEKDARGNTTFTFYNKLKQKRFTVDPEGGVIEWIYDVVGTNRVHCERRLSHALDLSQINLATITLEQLNTLIVRDPSDGQSWIFRDAVGREQFKINSQGQVKETVYDTANNPIKNILHAQPIDATLLPSMQTVDVVKWAATHQDTNQDRVTYSLFDEAHNERYVINPRGYISEKRYNGLKQVMAEIRYATVLADPQQVANLPIDQVDQAIAKDPSNDRETWYVFDGANRPQFTVTKIVANKATVTRFDHDANGNLTQTCRFAASIPWPLDYDDLVKTCRALVPTFRVDQITQSKFDNANREVKTINALNNAKTMEIDVLGNQQALIDEANNRFTFKSDDAKRRTDKILPSCDVTLVTQTQNDPHWPLTSQILKDVSIQEHQQLDANGNVETLIKAQGTPEQRTLQIAYNKSNQKTLVIVSSVAVDDPTQNASWQTRPEKNQTLTKQMVYDARKRKVAEKGFDDQWTFFIYDSEDREIYRILPNKTVVGKTYNIFCEQVTETKYANELKLNLSPYTQTGVPLAVLLDPKNGLQPSVDNDRTTTTTYNLAGKIATITKPSAPYFISDEIDGQYGIASPVEKRDYNAFDEMVFQGFLVDPLRNSYKRKIFWYDPRGKKAAVCGFNDEIDRKFFNVFGKRVALMQWADKPKISPDITTTLADLDAAYRPSAKDRFWIFTFDLNGDKLTKTLKNQVVQSLILQPGTNDPVLQDSLPKDLTQYFTYDVRRLKIAVENEKGGIEYTYYNAIKKRIAKTGITRTSLQGKKLTPLTYYGINAHGEEVLVTAFAAGTQYPQPNQLPQPLAIDATVDQTKLKFNNNRGLTIVEQTEEGAASFKTYNAARKMVREYHGLTEATPATTLVHQDEKRITFDANYNPLVTHFYRDSQPVKGRSTIAKYNAFNEVIAEGQLDGTERAPFYQFIFRTRSGFAWKHNRDKGAWKIEIPHLDGKTSITLESLDEDLDLSTMQLSDLPNLLNSAKYPFDKLARTENVYDVNNNTITQRAPVYAQAEGPSNIPLNVYVGSRYKQDFGAVSLNWLNPKETNVTPTFVLYPVDNENNQTTLSVISKNGRCGVDVSAFPTGIYCYTISYRLNAGNNALVYQTTGYVQFESLSNKNSVAVVPIVENDNQVRLVGNTQGLTAVKVWQGEGNLIAEASVIFDLKKQAFYANLNQLTSGSYTITPVSQAIPNPIESLPIAINTAKPSAAPLARQIDANVTLKWLESHIELDWQVPEAYANCQAKLAVVYIGADNQTHIQETTLTPGQTIATYTDNNGTVLRCNSECVVAVQSVFRVDLVLVLDDQNTYLPVLVNASNFVKSNSVLTSGKSETYIPNTIQTASFGTQQLVFISPVVDPKQYKTLLFKDMRDDAQAQWKVMPILGHVEPVEGAITPAGLVINATKLSFGNYPWILGQNEKIRPVLLRQEPVLEGNFTIVEEGAVFSSDNFDNHLQIQRPVQNYSYDRWKNTLQHTNSLGATMTNEYNGRDKVIKTIQPQVNVTDEHGKTTPQNPTTLCGYDELNNQVGVQDANQHTEGYVRDEASQTIKHVLGDGTLNEQSEKDIFGNTAIRIDDQNQSWKRVFNRRNQIMQQTTPLGRKFGFGCDELDHRIWQSYPSGATYRYVFNIFGDIQANYLPLGQKTEFISDRNHQWIQQINPDKTALFWNRDFWSNVQHHEDLGGADYYYKYNRRGLLLEEWREGGDPGQGLEVTGYSEVPGSIPPSFTINTQTYTLAYKHLLYQYRHNWLVGVNDLAQQQLTNYALDSEGRRVGLKVFGTNQTLLRQISTQLDALGKDNVIYDNQFTMNLSYDAVSNRRRMLSQGYFYSPIDITNSMIVISHDGWFTTDSTDREIIFDGVLNSANEITLATNQGSKINYVGNLRKYLENYRIVYPSNGGEAVAHNFQTLGWDKDSRLISTVTIANGGGVTNLATDTENYQWHVDDWVMDYRSDIWDSQWAMWPGIHKTVHETPAYNANGWQINDVQVNWQDQQDAITSTTTYQLDNNSGLVKHQHTDYTDPNNSKNNGYDDFDYQYRWREVPQLLLISGVRSNQNGKSNIACSQIFYTPNEQFQANLRGGDLPGVTVLKQTLDNIILSNAFTQNTLLSQFDSSLDMGNSNYLYTANDELLASYSVTLANLLAMNYQFDLLPNYLLPVSSSFPPRGPQRYVVQNGDTFNQLAARFYGDASFASQLAYQLGYGGSEDGPVPGTIVSIPAILPLHNRFGVYSSYNTLINILMENIYPSLHTPQPRPKHPHSSWWKTVVEAVVAVVVMIAVPQLAGLFFHIVGAMQFVVAGVAGAMSSAAEQGVAIALHDQTKFQWQSVFESALESMLIPENNVLMDADVSTLKEITLSQLGRAALSYGMSNAETQLLSMSVGLRRQFDFNEVLEAGIGGAVNAYTSVKLNNMSTPFSSNARLNYFEKNLVQQQASVLTQGALAAKLQHQRFDLENLEAEAVGTSIGASLGEWTNEKIADYRKAQSVSRGQSTTVASPNETGNSSPYSNNQNNSTAQQLGRLGLFGSSGQNTSSSNGENDYIPFPRMGNSDSSNDNNFGSSLFSSTKTVNVTTDSSSRGTSQTPFWSPIVNSLTALSPALGAVGIGLEMAVPYGASMLKNYVEEHGSVGINVSVGAGPAADLELGFSKQGVTVFRGMGVGVGFNMSISGNYEFQETEGFTSKTSVNASLGALPVQAGGSLMVSHMGPAFSLGIQPGEGLEIESVVGYTKTYSWNQVDNFVKRMTQ